MRRGTKWFTSKGLVWGLAMLAGIVGGVAAVAAPADGNGESSAFFVDVIGPGFAQPGNECLFRAVPKPPAVSPFTFQWKPPASGTDDFAHAIMPSESFVVVEVEVWDSNDAHSSGHITVQLSASHDPCGI